MSTQSDNNLKKINAFGFHSLMAISLLSMIMVGCRKEVQPELITNYTGKSYSEVFEAFWNGMNKNYVFWDIDTVDWNNKYKTYKPLFEFLDRQTNDSATEAKAVQYLVDMSKDLSDGHMSLIFDKEVSFNLDGQIFTNALFYPAWFRYYLRGIRPIPRTTFDEVIYDNYLTNAEYGTGTIEDYGINVRVNLGIIPRNNKKILYLEFSDFFLQHIYDDATTANSIKPVLDHFFRYTQDPSVDALIIDLRSNGGGDDSDLNFLFGHLITEPTPVGYIRHKNGAGRLDYTPWIKSCYVYPHPGSIKFTKPIAVLVDGKSLSMSELTAMAAKALFPKTKLVGEKTWGGTGDIIPDDDILALGGGFNVAAPITSFAGFKVFMTACEFRDQKLNSYEGKGLTPDIPITYDIISIKNNRDVQLDKAIEYVTQ